jgi:dTMP kinase
MKKGVFISMEGVDGSGKTTQLQLTARYLLDCGYEVVTTREPGGTKLAERIRNVVLDADAAVNPRTEVLLYLAARAEHVEKVIRPALEAGKIVLCDRFADSTMVYQGFVRGIETDKVKALCEFAADGLQPELTLLLDAAPEALLQRRADRGVKDRFEQEGLDFQKKVRAGFLLLANSDPQRVKKVNALQNTDAVQADIRKVLRDAGF